MTEQNQSKDERSALIGRKLGDYELTSVIASGGMARIYRGFDPRLERVAAVKVLMRELMESDDTLTDRFMREARAVARLDHPNIVPVFQSGEQDGYYFIAMKYVEGSDLSSILSRLKREGKLMDVGRALKIMEQIASALDYAHRLGIIHRDVKPSNILLDTEDRALLTDFGLALWQSVDKTHGTAFGTPRYISPEQALASERACAQSDVYSLAVVMFEILTGDMLFHADAPMQIALAHISEAPRPLRQVNPNLPAAAEKLMLQALVKEPEDRPKTATEFIDGMKAAFAGTSHLPAEATSSNGKTEAAISPSVGARTPVLADESALRKGVTGKTFDADTQVIPSSIRPQRRPPFLLIGVMLVVIAAGAVLLGSGIGGGTTPSPNDATSAAALTSATPAPTETPIPLVDGEPLSVEYDFDTLVIRNTSTSAIPLAGLTFTRRGASSVQFDASQAGTLPAGDCAVLIRSDRRFEAGAWDCVGKVAWQQSIDNSALFWRSEGGGAKFDAALDAVPLAACDTVTRTQKTTCTYNIPQE